MLRSSQLGGILPGISCNHHSLLGFWRKAPMWLVHWGNWVLDYEQATGSCIGAALVSWLTRAVVISWQEWLYQLLMFPNRCVDCSWMWDFWLLLFARFLHSLFCDTHSHATNVLWQVALFSRTVLLSILCVNSLSCRGNCVLYKRSLYGWCERQCFPCRCWHSDIRNQLRKFSYPCEWLPFSLSLVLFFYILCVSAPAQKALLHLHAAPTCFGSCER